MTSRRAKTLRSRTASITEIMSDYPYNFSAEIDGNLVCIPQNIVAKIDFSKSKRLRVDGEVNGIRIECALMPISGQWFLMVSKKLQTLCGAIPGEKVRIRFDIANQDNVDVPTELQFALEANDQAMKVWQDWTAGKRRSVVHGVASAKMAETRERRVEEVIGMLLGSRAYDSGIITMQDFENVDLRAGTITAVDDFPKAIKSAYKITADFGSQYGIRHTSAQITTNYAKLDLVGRQVIGAMNFAPKQIGSFISEFLLVGFYIEDGSVILAVPDRSVPDGAKLS